MSDIHSSQAKIVEMQALVASIKAKESADKLAETCSGVAGIH